jgi:tRNA (cytidine/uridine-2'-O-)-methyltransferase
LLRLALYQPDIPQNAGTLIRFAACLGLSVDIIEPCGFVLDDRRLRRSHMDYAARALIQRHEDWQAFRAAHAGRAVALETGVGLSYVDFTFQPDDAIILGAESTGLPDEVRRACAAHIVIPMLKGARSLNVATAAAMAAGEALRQVGGFTALEQGQASHHILRKPQAEIENSAH